MQRPGTVSSELPCLLVYLPSVTSRPLSVSAATATGSSQSNAVCGSVTQLHTFTRTHTTQPPSHRAARAEQDIR